MIPRTSQAELTLLEKEFPIIAILGPRQSGKTTLAQQQFPDYQYVSLEDPDHREFAQHDPRGSLDKEPAGKHVPGLRRRGNPPPQQDAGHQLAVYLR